MESLLDYFNGLYSSPYPDSENKKIADYLIGKTEFESIKSFLKPVKYLYGSSDVSEIVREVAKDKSNLLPRLGRFLPIVKAITDINGFFSFVAQALSALSIEEIYLEGGLGADALISDLLEGLLYGGNCHWLIPPKVLGYESYAAFLAGIYEKYPSGYEKLANSYSKVSLFPLLYLYTHDPAKNNDDTAEAVLVHGAKIINMMNKNSEAAFDSVKMEPRFSGNPYIERLRKLVISNKDDKKNRRYIGDLFYFAYVLSPSRSELMDLINYIYSYVAYEEAFRGFEEARKIILRKFDERQYFTEFLPLLEEGLVPKDRLFAYLAINLSEEWLMEDRKSFYNMLLENEKEALKAIDISGTTGGLVIAHVFWEKGMHLDKAASFDEKVLKEVLKNARAGTGSPKGQVLPDVTAVEEYFLGNNDIAPEKLPKIDLANHFHAVRSVALLSIANPLPARIFIYAVLHKQTYWFKRAFYSMRDLLGEKAAEDYLDALNTPVDAKISTFIDGFIDEYSEAEKNWLKKQVARIVGADLELLEAAFKSTSAKGRAFILETVYNNKADYNPKWLMDCLADSSKTVRDLAVAYLTPLKQLKDQMEPLTKSKTKTVRECAEKLLMTYSADVGVSGDFNALAYCAQHIPSGAAKTIAWTEFESLPKVRLADSETPADDSIVRGYIYLIVSQTEIKLPPGAAKIRESLNKEDLRILGERLYHIWQKNNAPAKQRGVLVLAALDCNDAFIIALKTDIQAWADASRGALAADAVRAMALQGGNLALMTVDSISKKFSNKQVQRAGEEAFAFAAEQLGVDPEVLGDRIVPNLGFDSRGECVIDYGNRSFIAAINPALQIDLKTSEGKAVKSLPAPGANDDQAKAAAAKTAFSTMKKSLKSVVGIQCLRLELALSNNRTWTKAEWTRLFVENPIMNMFAIGLIWGGYDAEGKLLQSFRYMEDGSFTDVEENEFELDDNVAIGLCHPLDMGDELIAAWTRQLSDYEIKQPVEQLNRKVFRFAEGNQNSVTEFGGAVVYAVSLLGKLQKLGWRKGSVQDAGGYTNFYKEDKKQGIGAWLNFSGTFVGADATEEVTVYDVVFYKAGTVQFGSYVYDEIKNEDKLALSQTPPRLYSEVCYDVDRATANRIRTEDDWDKNRAR